MGGKLEWDDSDSESESLVVSASTRKAPRSLSISCWRPICERVVRPMPGLAKRLAERAALVVSYQKYREDLGKWRCRKDAGDLGAGQAPQPPCTILKHRGPVPPVPRSDPISNPSPDRNPTLADSSSSNVPDSSRAPDFNPSLNPSPNTNLLLGIVPLLFLYFMWGWLMG